MRFSKLDGQKYKPFNRDENFHISTPSVYLAVGLELSFKHYTVIQIIHPVYFQNIKSCNKTVNAYTKSVPSRKCIKVNLEWQAHMTPYILKDFFCVHRKPQNLDAHNLQFSTALIAIVFCNKHSKMLCRHLKVNNACVSSDAAFHDHTPFWMGL